MPRREVLLMLRELFRDAARSHTDPDDQSGISTTYTVDQEQLMRNIEAELEKLGTDEPECAICGHGHEVHTAMSEVTGILHACKILGCECQEYRSL